MSETKYYRPSVLTNVLIAMRTTFQEQIDAISVHLDLFPGPGGFEDFVNEHTYELKWKADTNTIKTHIIGPINALIGPINKIFIAHKTFMDGTSTVLTEFKKGGKMRTELEETIDEKNIRISSKHVRKPRRL